MRMERHDLAALSAEELELFAYLLEEAGLEVDSRQPIVPRTLRSGLPLSFAQQRLWFLDQLQPGSSVYHIVVAVRLRGPLDPDAVARSLAAVVARHESLRTTFAMQDDQPVQVIAPTVEVPLPVVEVPPLPAAEREAMVAALVRAEVAPPFDLRRGPLIRARLLRLEQHDHILVLTLHHIVSDGWSQGVLLRELTSFYRGYAQNEPVSLPTLPIQYADYVLWQRAWMAGAVLEAQLAYWRRQLAGVAPLDLPTDYPRPQVAKDHGAIVEVVLPAALSAQIIRLSQQLGSTLFMTLLAAFQILLARYSEQDDIAVGSPIAGRVLPELEGLIGFFANTLVLRTDLAGQPTFAEVVARVRTMTLDAFAHQDLPFEKLVEDLQPERDPSRTPLFQVMFALQNAPRADVELPHLRLEPVATITQTAKFDLSLSLVETPAGIRGQIEYRADLFVALTIARMAAHFQTLLAAIVGDPSRSIDRLPLLTAAERAQIQGWEVTLPTEDACLHWLIEVQAKRVPASIAVEQHGAAITYAELDRRANQLAHHLRSLGVGPDVAVGLCLPRSIAFVVALLGVLKAGGCYVPLDPAYPQERLQLMLADSAARVLITQESLLHPEGTRLPGYTGTIVYVNRDAPQLDRLPTVAPRAEVQPDHVMLILYTSGSTGAPKGVLLTHRNLVSYLRAIRERCPLRPADRLLQLASISFDISAEDLFTTLTIGATVVLRTEALLSSPETFEATCARERITVLNLPTAFWHVLAEASESGQFTLPPSVRHVIIGGEHAALDRVRQWQARYGERASLLNSYGPTETTIGVTAYLAPTILPAHLFDTPIGRALVNVRTYVLDARLEPVPIGVPGELYIGGVQLARGYLNRPDLTAARFIPDPLSRPEGTRPGARLYRTGDRVRAMADGTLIFLGRADTQVKLRGFRVELGEIAAVLRQHPAVRDVVVLLRDERLVAYVVEQRTTEQRNKKADHESKQTRCSPAPMQWERGRVPSGCGEGLHSELRAFLGQRLPDYMVPSAFVLLDAWPLTPNGKLDHTALPQPHASDGAREPLVAPRDHAERWLAQIWADLLHTPVVDIHANFFALGGHSLLAVRMMAQIQQRLGWSPPLTTLLQAPTIAQLAAHLRQQRVADTWSPLVALQAQGRRRPLFLIHPIGGTVLCYADLARQMGPDQPVYGLQARGVEHGQTPHRSVAALAEEYLAAIRSVQPGGPYRLGGWSFGGVVAFAIASQFQRQGETIELLALIDSAPPMPEVPLPDDTAMLHAFLQDLGGMLGTSLGITVTDLAPLAADERLAYVLAQAQRQEALLPGMDLDRLKRLAAVFSANLSMLAAYPAAPAPLPVALLVAEVTAQRRDLAGAWRALATVVQDRVVPGTHYTLLRSPHVQAVADWLGTLLVAA